MPDGNSGLGDKWDGDANQSPEVGRQENFRKIIEGIARTRSSPYEVFIDFVRVCACTVANQTREQEYLEVVKRYSKDDLVQFGQAFGRLVEEMEAKPFTDILGPYYIEIGSKFSRDLRGEFYTPRPVAEAIAGMLVDVPAILEAGKPVTVCDPASGSGGLILSLAEKFAPDRAVDLLRVTCMDISRIACDMAYINTTLWGIPAKVVLGDTLRGTVEYEWRNIHWYRVGQHLREDFEAFMGLMRGLDQPSSEQPRSPPDTKDGGQSPDQQEWNFE